MAPNQAAAAKDVEHEQPATIGVIYMGSGTAGRQRETSPELGQTFYTGTAHVRLPIGHALNPCLYFAC